MKGFAKGIILIGILSVGMGLVFIIVDYVTDDWSSIMSYITYILFDDPERAFWQVGIVIMLIGYWLLSRQKRKKRIFY